MTRTDEDELARLSEQLGIIASRCELDSSAHEALQKAGIALMLTFLRGGRREVDSWRQSIDAPLTETQRAHLRRIGVDPDGSR